MKRALTGTIRYNHGALCTTAEIMTGPRGREAAEHYSTPILTQLKIVMNSGWQGSGHTSCLPGPQRVRYFVALWGSPSAACRRGLPYSPRCGRTSASPRRKGRSLSPARVGVSATR